MQNGTQHPMKFKVLKFGHKAQTNGIKGHGKDDIGEFSLSGTFDPMSGECHIIK